MSLIEESMNHPKNKEPLSKNPRKNAEICITIEKKLQQEETYNIFLSYAYSQEVFL